MSVQGYFNEVQAVCEALSEFLTHDYNRDEPVVLNEETEAAIWQAVELLSRAYTVLLPMVQAEVAKDALYMPDVVTQEPKKARLYDAQGRPL